MMNYLLANGACCCLQWCCKEIGQTAQKLMGRISFLKFMHLVVYFAFIGAVFLAMFLLRKWEFFMRVFAQALTCKALTDEFDCISASVIYRIMLSLFLLSALLLAVTLISSPRVSRIINEGLFFSKLIVSLAIFLAVLQISNQGMMYFSNVSGIFSYIFVVWQIIIVIDLAYLWGIKWAYHYSQSQNTYGCLLISFTIGNYVLSVLFNIYGYILSGTNDSIEGHCKNYPNILSTIFLVGMFCVQLLHYNKQNSLLATSSLSIFVAYWLLAAVFSSETCNSSLVFEKYDTVIGKTQFLKFNIPVSLLFVFLSSFGSIYGSSNEEITEQFIELQQNLPAKQLKPEQEEKMREQKGVWASWHCFMMAMSLYVSMILTDWGSGDILSGKFVLTANAEISKVFTATATCLVYCWTLIAPRVLRGRNFEFE